MSVALLRATIWPFVGLGLAVLGVAALTPVARTSPATPVELAFREAGVTLARANLDSVARAVTDRDLFRRSRRPAPISAAALPGSASPVPAVPKPTLTLVGLVAGTEPSAVVEGFPGVQGPRVVRPGDVIGGLVVGRISQTMVEISGIDTVWVLTVREPWRQP